MGMSSQVLALRSDAAARKTMHSVETWQLRGAHAATQYAVIAALSMLKLATAGAATHA